MSVPLVSAAPAPPVPLTGKITEPSAFESALSSAQSRTGMLPFGIFSRARSFAWSQLSSWAVIWALSLVSVMPGPGATVAAATTVYDVSMRLPAESLSTAKAVPTDGLPWLSRVDTA